MSLSYQVTVETVGHTWTTADTDTPKAGDLADPFVLHVGPPIAPGWWQQHEFETCTFTIVGTRADLYDLDLDSDVYATLEVDGVTLREFRGIVVDLTAARRRGSTYAFTITAVDALRRLTQSLTGTRACPSETVGARWDRLVAETGLPVASISVNHSNVGRLCAAMAANPIPLWDALVGLSLDVSGDVGGCLILRTSGTPGAFTYTITETGNGMLGSPNPGSPLRVTDQAGPVVSLVPRTPAPVGPMTRPACEFAEGSWSRHAPDRVTVAILRGATFEAVGRIDTRPAVTYSRETSLANPADARSAAAFHLCTTHPTALAWQAEAVEWELWNASAAVLGSPSMLSIPLILTGSLTDTPGTPRGLLAGVVREATITVAGGRPRVTYQLDPLTTPGGVLGVAWTALAFSPFTTRTWSQLNPTDTWHDYRLANT